MKPNAGQSAGALLASAARSIGDAGLGRRLSQLYAQDLGDRTHIQIMLDSMHACLQRLESVCATNRDRLARSPPARYRPFHRAPSEP